jgi:hypothetical protein
MQGSEGAFNPSKTFGGERARMMMMKGEADDFGQQKRETGNYRVIQATPAAISSKTPLGSPLQFPLKAYCQAWKNYASCLSRTSKNSRARTAGPPNLR